MELSTYDRTAIGVLAAHLQANVPFQTVSKLLNHEGWNDLLETIFQQYPDAFLKMCEPHQREIEAEMRLAGEESR